MPQEKLKGLKELIHLLNDGRRLKAEDAQWVGILARSSAWNPAMDKSARQLAQKYMGQLVRRGMKVELILSKLPPIGKIEPKPRPLPPALRKPSASRLPAVQFKATLHDDMIRLASDGYPGRAMTDYVRECAGALAVYDNKKIKGKQAKFLYWEIPISCAGRLLWMIDPKRQKIKKDALISKVLKARVALQAKSIADSEKSVGTIEVAGIGGRVDPDSGEVDKMRGYQRAGVEYFVRQAGGIVSGFFADEMGIGKTLQSLATVRHLNTFPLVIVVPASVKLNWYVEVNRWVRNLNPGSVLILSGRKPSTIHASTGIVIINYDILKGWAEELIKWSPQAVIFDEAHKLKDGSTQRSKAAKKLSLSKSVNVRLMLTGTPVIKNTFDYLSPLTILGRIQQFGGRTKYLERYCKKGHFGGYESHSKKRSEELTTVLRRDGMYVRRLKKVVMPQLPDKSYFKVPFEIRQMPEYKAAKKEAKRFLTWARVEMAAAKQERRKPEGRAVAANMIALTPLMQAVSKCKIKAALKWMDDQISYGEKLIIFTVYTDSVNVISNHLKCPKIYGDTKVTDRHGIVERLNNDPDCMAVVGNTVAMGEGLNMQKAARTVVFFEEPWTTALFDQCTDRAHRDGQKLAVMVYSLLATGTPDDVRHNALARKRIDVDAATEGDVDVRKEMALKLEKMLED